jgi:hypothetical protein
MQSIGLRFWKKNSQVSTVESLFFLREHSIKQRTRLQHKHTHIYERTHAKPTLMSTFKIWAGKFSRQD